MHRKIRKYILTTGLVMAAVAATAVEPNKDFLWELAVGEYIITSPAIDRDGTIYVTASGNASTEDISGGKLAAVTPDGYPKWTFKTHCDIKSSPAIGADGTVYFGCRDRYFYAVNRQGGKKWSFKTGAWVDASPAIGTNEAIYFGSWDHKFYALNPDGSKKWEFTTGGPIDSSAAIASDGTIYFGSHDHKFYALNPDGSKRWVFNTGDAIVSSPAIDEQGMVYFTSVDGRLYELNPDGTKKMALWTGGTGEASPAVDAQGNIYICVNNLFCAFRPDGTKRWDWGYPIVKGTPLLTADGGVFFCADSGSVFGFNADGSDKTYYPLGEKMQSSPAIGADGTIYAGGVRLHALKGAATLAKGGWAKFRGGAMQTGRAGP